MHTDTLSILHHSHRMVRGEESLSFLSQLSTPIGDTMVLPVSSVVGFRQKVNPAWLPSIVRRRQRDLQFQFPGLVFQESCQPVFSLICIRKQGCERGEEIPRPFLVPTSCMQHRDVVGFTASFWGVSKPEHEVILKLSVWMYFLTHQPLPTHSDPMNLQHISDFCRACRLDPSHRSLKKSQKVRTCGNSAYIRSSL